MSASKLTGWSLSEWKAMSLAELRYWWGVAQEINEELKREQKKLEREAKANAQKGRNR